jgi:ABC-type glycerol-3-phosphate transport system substrate-binding protein
MDQSFVDILKKLTAEQGKEALLNPAKCKALLADYTKGEYKKESRLLLQALDAGVQKEIINTAELELCKQQQIRVLQEEHFLSAEAAADIVDTLALVLKGEQVPQGAFCSNCGKELQKEWGVCPYCGTTVKTQQNPPQTKPQPLPSPAPIMQTSLPSPAIPLTKKGNTKRNLLIAVAILLVILIVIVVGKRESTTSAPTTASSNNERHNYEQTTQANGKLIIWSFTDELANFINKPFWGFKATHPGIDLEYSQTSSDKFQAILDPVLASGQGGPDIIALESSFVRKYVESDKLLDITDIYETNKNKLLSYPVEIGSYNGRVYAMSWQVVAGAMFYRRSLARKYLGTDDPKTVQTYFSSFNKFLETAQLLKQKSNGSCVVVSSLGDLRNPFLSARRNPWIVNGKVEVDPAMEQYMEICKILHDNRLVGRVGQWSEGWFQGLRGGLVDEAGKSVEVFSCFFPNWGLQYVLKTNAPNTSGDWAMVQGPSPYRWGGTWIGAYKGTKNVAAVKEFIRYVATDDAFLEGWAVDTGDIVSNINVINKIKNNYREPFLGGQNHYAEFAEYAKGVNGRLVQSTDEAIEALFDEAVITYINGEKNKAKALADFKLLVQRQLGF